MAIENRQNLELCLELSLGPTVLCDSLGCVSFHAAAAFVKCHEKRYCQAMTVKEATAEEVNAVANHPEVYPMLVIGAIHPQGPLDYEETCDHHTVTALTNGGGFCAIFKWTSPGCYEVHVMATPEARGAGMMASSREMLAYMKNRGARRVWGQPSLYNRAAQTFVRRMGLRYQGTGHEPIIGDVAYFETEL